MTAPTMGAIAPEVLANGTPLSSTVLEQLTGLKVKARFGLPARATLRFDDIGYAIAAGSTFAIGSTITVQMAAGQKLFTGEVTGVDLQLDRGVPDFVVVADDLSYKMTLGNKVRSFAKMKYSDIVQTIAGEYGLSATVDSTPTQYDYVQQTDSDFGFVSEMAERTGFDWWIDDRTLMFSKPVAGQATAVVTVGEDLRQFSVRASALHPGATKVTGWTPKTKQGLVGEANAAQSGLLPTANLVSGYARVSALAGKSAVTTAADSPMVQEEAASLAQRAVNHWSTGAVTARGTTLANSAIKLGGPVTVANAGPANGTYVVTEVEHSYTEQGFETRFVAGDRRPSGLVDTLTSKKPTSFRRDGLVIGVVTMVGNSEGSPGDIKVKYPGVGDQFESGWGRMVSVGGGGKRGVTFMPEVNDEVIVGFEGGDTRKPVILGALFNGKDAQPAFVSDGGAIASRQITSRLGHVVEFGDGTSPDKQYISLVLAGGQTSVMMSKKEFIANVPAGIPFTISAGNSNFKIANDGSITIQGSKITLKADTDVEISGLNVTTKASVKNSASGTMVELKAQAQAEVSASGPVMVKGNPVMVN